MKTTSPRSMCSPAREFERPDAAPPAFVRKGGGARFGLWLWLLLGSMVLLGGRGAALAAEVDPASERVTVSKEGKLEYQFRLVDPSGVAKVTAKLPPAPETTPAPGATPAPGQSTAPAATAPRLVEMQVTGFAEAGNNVALLFMIDDSAPTDKGAPNRGKSIEASKRFVTGFRDLALSRQRMAAYSYASQLQLVAYFGATSPELALAMKNVQPVKGPSDTYLALHEAVGQLQRYTDAQRKAIVLLTSGSTKENLYHGDAVLDELKKAGIVLFVIGYPDQQQDYPFLTWLNHMAAETKGKSIEADANKTLAEKFDNTIGQCMASGGVASVDAAGLKKDDVVEFEIQTKSGETVKRSYTMTENVVPGVASAGSSPVASSAPAASPAPKSWMDWAKENPWIVGSGIGVLVLLAILIIWLSLRKKETYPPIDYAPAYPDPTPQPPYTGSFGSGSIGGGSIEADNGTEDTVRFKDSSSSSEENSDAVGTRIVGKNGGGGSGGGSSGGGRAYARLKILEGDVVPDYTMRTTTIKIGRASDQDMVLKNDSVSRAHAVISRKPDGTFLLNNLTSNNGVFVNGDEIPTDCVVKHGDTIELGEVHLKFQII